ncbi:hypothetical protein [Rhodopirellula bahusiensis]|uniref:hypothetical protein n=1 Tax=Rhodopirellula bahusiensis TaxID=2014065 RepID=UPI0032667CA7
MDFENDHWPITVEDRRKVVESLTKIIQSDDWSVAIRATRLVIQMDELNHQYEKQAAAKLRNDLEAFAEANK